MTTNIREHKKFTERDFAQAANYDSEFSGFASDTIGIGWDATLTGVASGFATNASQKMLGSPELVQDEQPVIRLQGPDWWYLASLLRGGNEPNQNASTTLSMTRVELPLHKLHPLALVDGSSGGSKLRMRGTFGSLSDYATTPPATLVGKIRPYAKSSNLDPRRGYFRPRFYQFEEPLETAAFSRQRGVPIDGDFVIMGLMLRALDASAGVGSFGREVDGLIRNVRVSANIRDVATNRELIDSRWGIMKDDTLRMAGFANGDRGLFAGVIWVPFVDMTPDGASMNGGILFKKGDSFNLDFDTQTAVEAEFASVAPAAGDKVVVSIIGFEKIAPVAGDPNAGVQRRFELSVADRKRLFASKRKTGAFR